MKHAAVSFTKELADISNNLIRIELIFIKDAQFVYQSCSKDFVKLLRVKHEEMVIGKSDFDVKWHNTCANVCRQLDEQTKNKKQAQYDLIEYLVSQQDGHDDRRYAHLIIGYLKPLLSPQGEFLGLYGNSVSVADMHKSEIEHYWQMNEKEKFYLFPADQQTYLTKKEAKFLFYWLNAPVMNSIYEIGTYLQLTKHTVYSYCKIIREKVHALPRQSIHDAVRKTLFFDQFKYLFPVQVTL